MYELIRPDTEHQNATSTPTDRPTAKLSRYGNRNGARSQYPLHASPTGEVNSHPPGADRAALEGKTHKRPMAVYSPGRGGAVQVKSNVTVPSTSTSATSPGFGTPIGIGTDNPPAVPQIRRRVTTETNR
jgi:hypothetical protein